MTAIGGYNYTIAEVVPLQGCTPPTNAAALAGSIAVVRRGGCAFATKAQNVQQAGAAALVIVSNDDDLVTVRGKPTDSWETLTHHDTRFDLL